MREQLGKQLDELRFIADGVTSAAVTEDDIPDACGEAKFVEDKLAAFRRGLISEASPYAKGNRYQMTTSYPNGYSYNVQAILADCAAEGVTIMDLINAGAMEVDFGLRKLQGVMDAAGITTRVAPRELQEGDMHAEGPHIGKFKKPPYTRVVGIEGKETSMGRRKAEKEAYEQ